MYMKGKYINWFLRLKCRADVLSVNPKVFKDAKEITESISVYNALTHEMQVDPMDKRVVCVVPGDGKYTQTGILLAFLTKWTIISIDPEIAVDELDESPIKIDRFTYIKDKIENVKMHVDGQLVFACTHSHAPLSVLLKNFTASKPRKLVNLPCCKPHDFISARPYYKYEDPYVLSPKNIIYLWDEARNDEISATTV